MLNQQNKIKERLEKREARIQTLASAFGRMLDTFGVRASDADFVQNWKNIVGPDIAQISNVVAVKNTKDKMINVVLRPINPAFALELSYKLKECEQKINTYYGRSIVAKITIRK